MIGILASIDWNSNRWKDIPDPDDLKASNYGYVQDKGVTHTHLNFDYDNPDIDGYVYALLPQLWTRTPQEDNVQVVIVKSQSWRDGINYIIGLYLFPKFKRKSRPSEFTKHGEREVNIKALAENIVLLDNFIPLTPTNIPRFLPVGKDLGKQGFNYLTKENVLRIFDEMTKLNVANKRLSNIKLRFLKSN